MTDQDRIAELVNEVTILRAALLPFAHMALTRTAKTAPDDAPVIVPMSLCKAAQRALAAD